MSSVDLDLVERAMPVIQAMDPEPLSPGQERAVRLILGTVGPSPKV